MPGPLQGAVEGFQAGLNAQRDAAMLGIERQRAQNETDRLTHEQNRQDNLDKLSVLQSQAETLAQQARPHLAYMSAPPVDPKTDPEGYEKWLDSDEFKSHKEQADALHSQVTDLYGQRKAVQDQFIGSHLQTAKTQAAQNYGKLAAGGDIRDIPDGQVADMFALKAKTDPSVFLRDPNGHAPIDDINGTLQSSLQSGNWNTPQAAKAVTALVPELGAAVGHNMAGGKVTGFQPTRIHAVDGDPDNLHFTASYQIHMPDNTVKVVQGPPDQTLPVPMKELGNRLTTLQRLGDLSQHPDLQAKIQKSFQDRTTSFHQLNDALLSVGIPANELLPAPYGHVTLKPGESMYKTSGTTGEIVGGPEATVAPKRAAGTLGLAQQMVDNGEASSLTDALDAINESKRLSKNPPADGGAAAASLIDSRKQKAGDVAHRGAVLQLARERGYVVDKDGNTRYGSDDKDGKYKKGEAVNDADFDDAVSTTRQAQDEAIQAGKPLPTSKLVSMAKDKLKATQNDRGTQANGIKAQLKAGKIDRDEAMKQLKALGFS